jgi:hypothetical protein
MNNNQPCNSREKKRGKFHYLQPTGGGQLADRERTDQKGEGSLRADRKGRRRSSAAGSIFTCTELRGGGGGGGVSPAWVVGGGWTP